MAVPASNTFTVRGRSGSVYTFGGPYAYTDSLEDKSGVYAIVDHRSDGSYHLLDVGESHTVKTRIQQHDRKLCWERHKHGHIMFAVYYTPNAQQFGRKGVEQDIRGYYQIPCGVQ